MNDIRRGRVTSYMIDIRYSAVAEFSGGQIPGSSKLGQRPRRRELGDHHASHHASLERRVHNLATATFQSIFGPPQERDKWRVPL
jgi:hypothetical protein